MNSIIKTSDRFVYSCNVIYADKQPIVFDEDSTELQELLDSLMTISRLMGYSIETFYKFDFVTIYFKNVSISNSIRIDFKYDFVLKAFTEFLVSYSNNELPFLTSSINKVIDHLKNFTINQL